MVVFIEEAASHLLHLVHLFEEKFLYKLFQSHGTPLYVKLNRTDEERCVHSVAVGTQQGSESRASDPDTRVKFN